MCDLLILSNPYLRSKKAPIGTKYSDPEKIETAMILPCLNAHNLIFDNNDLKFELPNLYLQWYVHLNFSNYRQ